MTKCLERVATAAQRLTSYTLDDLEALRGRALSPQGRLECAALALSALTPEDCDHVPHGREAFESIMGRLTARDPGPDDPEDCSSIRATCLRLTTDECKEIAADLLELYWRVEKIERRH